MPFAFETVEVERGLAGLISVAFTLACEGAAMYFANVGGRASLIRRSGAVDVEKMSDGRFPADPQEIFACWGDFVQWSEGLHEVEGVPFHYSTLGSPVPRPGQVFAVGLNYAEHAAETGMGTGDADFTVFTKFPSCVTGPYGEIELPQGGHTDWEIELVVVIGHRARTTTRWDAWRHVAGLCIGQDISERRSQLAGPVPQFSLAKSFAGFGPIGPWLVTTDEFSNPEDLALSATLNGETVQSARTTQMIFDVPNIIANLSAVVTLWPGDVIFTGTPSGVGMGRKPPRWLAPGDELVSTIEGIGELRHTFVAPGGLNADSAAR